MKTIFQDKRILMVYIIVIILIGLGFTYAISSANISLGLTTGIVRIDEKAYGNTEFDASNLDLVPILDSEVEKNEENVIKIDFTVGGASTNNNDNVIYDIALKDLEVNCDLLSPYVKWKLVKNGTKLSEGSLDYKFDTIDNNGRFLLTTIQQDLPKYDENETGYDNYNFYMWISDSCQDSDISNCTNATDQSNLMKKTLDGKIEVELYTESKKELTRNPASSATSSGCSNRYAVNYNLNGGPVSTSEKKYVISGSTFGELPTPTKTSTVTFDTAGGNNITNIKNDSSTTKAKIKLLADTSNKKTINYNFLGWYLEKNYTTKVEDATIVKTNENVNLYAKWEDAKVTLPSTTKEGSEFLGWYSDKNLKNKIGNAGDTYQIYNDTTVYAKWKKLNYTITYDSNGGSTCSPKIVANGSTYGSLCEPTKTGYSFNGWYTSLDGNTKVTSSTVASSDATIYAHWTPNTYKLTFNENYQKDDMSNWSFQYQPRFSISYDSATNMNTVSVAGASGWEILYLPIGTISGREYQLSFDYEVPTAYTALSGYSGVGYQILKSINESDNSANAIASGNIQTSATTSKVTKNLIFSGTGSTVYFAFNFGMAADGVTTTLKLGNVRISSTISKTYGETIGDLLSTTRPNYTLDGWYTSSSNGTQISSSTSVPSADTTYYAHWTETAVNVTFNGNKFSTYNRTEGGLTITYDANTSYLTLNGTQSASVILMNFGGQSFSNGEQYKITLDYISGTHTSSNGGCIATDIKKAGPADLSTRNNADVEYPDSGNRSNTLTVSSTAASEGSVLQVWLWVGNAANSNVFNNYTVKVNIAKVQTKSYTNGSTYNTFVDNPTRLGYTFVGWYDNTYKSYPLNYYSDKYPDLKNAFGTDQRKLYDHWIKYGMGEGRRVASYTTADSVNLNEDTTFYAGWIASSYTATMNLNGGTEYGNIPSTWTAYYNQTYNIDSYKPTRTGYTFDGWYTAATGGSKFSNNWTWTAEDFTFYAHWTRNFTCANTGGETAYAGGSWYTNSNDGSTCDLSLNATSGSSGTYNEAVDKLKAEYFKNGSTLKLENEAGLISEINTNASTNFSTNYGPGGAYWYASSAVYTPFKDPQYGYSSTNLSWGERSSDREGNLSSNLPYDAKNFAVNTTGYYGPGFLTLGNDQSTFPIPSGSYTVTKTLIASENRTVFKSQGSGTSALFKYKVRQNAGSYNNYQARIVNLYACGGDYHGKNTVTFTAKSSNAYKYVHHFSGTTDNARSYSDSKRTYWYAGSVSFSNKTGTFDANFSTGGSCEKYSIYSITNGSRAVYYRLHIRVKI